MKIVMPLAIYKPRKTKKDKRISLSMNTYRNLHYIENNRLKQEYKKIVKEQIQEKEISDTVSIHIDLYADNKRSIDLDNWCIVQSKFFGDALVELGLLPDDNTDHIKQISYTYKGVDTHNGRCEIFLHTI